MKDYLDVASKVVSEIASKVTGKVAQVIATKAVTKAAEKSCWKICEETRQLVGVLTNFKFRKKKWTAVAEYTFGWKWVKYTFTTIWQTLKHVHYVDTNTGAVANE